MSTSYSAWLVIGCTVDELDIPVEKIEELGLDSFYSGSDRMLVGIGIFASPDYGYVDLPDKYRLEEVISINFAKFLTLTGKAGKLYLTVKVL